MLHIEGTTIFFIFFSFFNSHYQIEYIFYKKYGGKNFSHIEGFRLLCAKYILAKKVQLFVIKIDKSITQPTSFSFNRHIKCFVSSILTHVMTKYSFLLLKQQKKSKLAKFNQHHIRSKRAKRFVQKYFEVFSHTRTAWNFLQDETGIFEYE